jgi:hypothetical protein
MKKKGKLPAQTIQDKPATLKDLLSPETLGKLKAQADALKAEEAKLKDENKKRAEEARKAEVKKNENDFEYLLKNSRLDWREHK